MRLLDKFQEAQKDPELLSLREALAMVKVRVYELIGRVDRDESPGRWRDALEAWSAYKSSRGSAWEEKNFAKLDRIMEAAYHDYAAWRQVFDALDLERRLSESERKRLIEMQQMITAEDVARLVTALQAAVIKVVDDPRKLKRLQYEFVRLAGVNSESGAGRSVETAELVSPGDLDTGEFLDS